MRIIFSLLVSAFVVVSLFYLIIGLIHQDIPSLEIEDKAVMVNIEDVKKEAPEKKAKSLKKKVVDPEPTLNSEIRPSINHDISSPDQPLINLNVAQTDFKFQSKEMPKLQENWVQPTASSQIDAKALGEQIGEQKTLRKVIPMSTRRPQIPKIAWENKINGWVTVSLEVTPSGHTENIQIVDASPRGVFEDEAVSAVKRWQYYSSPDESNRRLLQKIEFNWKDYPYNWE